MDTSIVKLREAKALFPLAETMAEGLTGAVETSTAYTDDKLRPLRTDISGINERMKEMVAKADGVDKKAGDIKETIKARAEQIQKDAGEASSAAQHAANEASVARQEAEKASAAAEAAAGKLEELAARDERAPEIAVKALETVVKATVTDSDESGKEVRVEKTGQPLIQHLAAGIENAKAAVGRAMESSEHASEMIETAKGIIEEQKAAVEDVVEENRQTVKQLEGLVEKAEQNAAEAKNDAAAAKGLLEQIQEGFELMKEQVAVMAGLLLGRADAKDPDTIEVLESAIEAVEGESQ